MQLEAVSFTVWIKIHVNISAAIQQHSIKSFQARNITLETLQTSFQICFLMNWRDKQPCYL